MKIMNIKRKNYQDTDSYQISVRHDTNDNNKTESKKTIRFFEFWRGIGRQANDNASIAIIGRTGYMRIAALAVLFSALASLSSSAVITRAILDTDDRVMSAIMDINPESMGLILNKVNIGE
jgi:hypothetical protein